LSSIYDKVAHFVGVAMRNFSSNYINEVINNLESSSYHNIQVAFNNLNLPVHLEYLAYELVTESEQNGFTLKELIELLKASTTMANYQISNQPVITPVWTGPTFENHIQFQTYQTVKQLINSAKHEIFIVGYSFSFVDNTILTLLRSIEAAAMRGCRINIVINRNVKNVSQLFENWEIDGHLLNVYEWKGSNDQYTSLHAKLVMIDQDKVLLTSANFSLHGFQKNIETGVVIENHNSIKAIWNQYHSLMRYRQMKKVY